MTEIEQLAVVFVDAYRTKQPLTPAWPFIAKKNRDGVIAGLSAVIAEMQAHSPTSDIGKVATALGLFASAIKSGEAWSETCETAQREAHEALVRVAALTRENREPATAA